MTDSKRKVLIPEGFEHQYEHWHLAPAVKSGELIFCSGQLGIDPRGKLSEDPEEQIEAAFQNLKKLLSGVGSSLQHIVEFTSFHVDLKNTLSVFGKVKGRYIQEDYCAQTAVGVEALGVPGAIVELKVVCVQK